MKYLAVLGRQPLISVAELESLFENVKLVSSELAEFVTSEKANIGRLGGVQKLAVPIEGAVVGFLRTLPKDGKITLGVSDYSHGATAYRAQGEALKLKRFLVKLGYSVRVIPNKAAVLSSATSFHNRLWTETRIELLKLGKKFYRVVQVQNIEEYAKRDQRRPARDAKVGMLPPKLAQILINLCGDLPRGSRLLDPFCGTGVVLQEAMLMGLTPYGTDLSERMVEYTKRNLEWLEKHIQGSDLLLSGISGGYDRGRRCDSPVTTGRVDIVSQKKQIASSHISFLATRGDATVYQWDRPINAVACEGYLGQPMSIPPTEIKLKQEKQECGRIVLRFLKNLAEQVEAGTPVVMAVPAWLRPDGQYERLNILDEIQDLGYNVMKFENVGQEHLLYHREKQVVAREIIVLRKK